MVRCDGVKCTPVLRADWETYAPCWCGVCCECNCAGYPGFAYPDLLFSPLRLYSGPCCPDGMAENGSQSLYLSLDLAMGVMVRDKTKKRVRLFISQLLSCQVTGDWLHPSTEGHNSGLLGSPHHTTQPPSEILGFPSGFSHPCPLSLGLSKFLSIEPDVAPALSAFLKPCLRLWKEF